MSDIDKHFPYKDKDGVPAYRPGQKEACIKTIEAFQAGKRAVVIDAPVGSGKSVINYTLLKCLGKGTYITAQKTLQDQIDSEGWPGVKVVKGKNAYACTAFHDINPDARCDANRSDRYQTCHDKTGFQYPVNSQAFYKIIESIDDTRKKYGKDASMMRLMTGFANSSEVDYLIDNIQTLDERSGNPQMSFVKKVGCNITPVECPVKSARLMARLAPIAVLNPDIYYHLNRVGYFADRNYMVVDEAHRLEDAIQRIFKMELPIGLIKDCFGVDFTGIAPIGGVENFVSALQDKLKTEIIPYMCCLQLMAGSEQILMVHNAESYMKAGGGKMIEDNQMMDALNKSMAKIKRDDSFCLINVLEAAVTGSMARVTAVDGVYSNFSDLYDIMRSNFRELCKNSKCTDDTFDPAKFAFKKIANYIKLSDNLRTPMGTANERHRASGNSTYGRALSRFIGHTKSIIKVFDQTVSVMDSLVRSKYKDNRVFVKHLEMKTKEKACRGTQYHRFYVDSGCSPEDAESVLQIIPIHIECLLQNFFFTKDKDDPEKTKKVILSSGTWPDPKGMMASYGFHPTEFTTLVLPPLFPSENRPIYVVTDKTYTDFSTKGENGYYYQTEAGSRKFNKELHETIEAIRKSNGKDCNIAVHTFNFTISKLIAEYYPALNNSFLLYLPRIKEPIINKVNHHTVTRVDKEALIHFFSDNPASGLTLIGPSLSEGLDFKGDICRAQIILKAPIPNLGDPYNSYRFNGCEEVGLLPDRMFLDRKCAIDLNQAYGRNVRSVDDFGSTYILDLGISKRLGQAFNVMTRLPGAPGNMAKLNMRYIKQGIKCSKNKYGKFEFIWPH